LQFFFEKRKSQSSEPDARFARFFALLGIKGAKGEARRE